MKRNAHRETALRRPCRLSIETAHPRFGYKLNGYSVVLTINAGHE